MELKEQIKQELVEKKEKERLERVKLNSELQEITLYSEPGSSCSVCNKVRDLLESEGIKYIDKVISKNVDEFNYVSSTVNMGNYPVAVTNGYYLVQGRDFTNEHQLLGALIQLAKPTHKNPPLDSKILEHMKTGQYGIIKRLESIENNIKPITAIIQNLMNEVEDDE